MRKVLETGCHESHAPYPSQSLSRGQEVNYSVPKRRWAVGRGGVAPILQKGGLEGRVCKSYLAVYLKLLEQLVKWK